MIAGIPSPYRPWLDVSLPALRANYSILAGLAGRTGAETGAVVKGDGYGTGIEMAAAALWQAGCRTFFTAFTTEALKVRAALPEAEIYVLSPLVCTDLAALLEHRLTPCLYELEDVERWVAGARAGDGILPAALHFETGINRLGIPAAAAPVLAAADGPFAALPVRLVMSHLASADDPGARQNREQLARFRAVAAQFPEAKASLCNSGGVFLGPEYHFDLVRPGVALFGHDPHCGGPAPAAPRVRPVASFRTVLGQKKTIEAGEGVGYGATYVASTRQVIGSVMAGYADGVPRCLSTIEASGGPAFDIGGYRAPIIGRVSMDSIVVDLTDVPESVAVQGAVAELFGERIAIEETASHAHTIPYELLTGIGSRVMRRYSGESEGRP